MADKTVSQAENNKLIFDFLKHLTTLSSGSVLVIAALSDKLFAPLGWDSWLVTSVCSFLASTVFSVLAMWTVIIDVGMGESATKARLGWLGFIAAVLATFAFLCGLSSLVGIVSAYAVTA